MLLVFIPLYIAATLAIGFWASKRIKTIKDFTLAGRSLSTTVVGITIFATWFGSNHIMGAPGYFVEGGILGSIMNQFGMPLSLLLIGSFYAKKMYQLNIVTISDFFRIRYNKSVELVTSLIQLLSFFSWIAAQFVALAYLFQSVLGMSIQAGILLGALVVVVYTYLGGMWAVSYTDVVQSILIVIGLAIVLWSILEKTGGVSPLFANRPDSFLDFFPKAGLYHWTDYLALWIATGLGGTCAPEVYQRIFSARSGTSGSHGVLLSALLLFTIGAIPLIIGLGAAKLHPELMGSDHGQNLIPAMIMQYTSMPLQVLFFGAIISAILSTCSGAMLAPASIIGENILKPYLPNMSDKRLLLWTRISVVVVAAISCYFAFHDSDILGLVVASAVLLLVSIFAPLTFGLYWKRSSVFGAWTAILAGGIIWFISNRFETRIDPSIYGTVASCLGMIIGSLFRPDLTTTHSLDVSSAI